MIQIKSRHKFQPGDLIVPDMEKAGGREIYYEGFVLGEFITNADEGDEILVNVIVVSNNDWYLPGKQIQRYCWRFKKLAHD